MVSVSEMSAHNQTLNDIYQESQVILIKNRTTKYAVADFIE